MIKNSRDRNMIKLISDRDTNVPGTLPGVPPHLLLEAVPEALWVVLVFVRAHAHFVDYPRPPTLDPQYGNKGE